MLALFPPGLEGTLLIPVLLGALVMALFTEWWGWDFAGVVVPGYLASVLLLEPVVAAVVVVEAILVWAAARALDAFATRAGLAYPVFGRDRFFLILVASVLVRLGVEGWVLPAVVVRMAPWWPGVLAHRTEMFGIGLVLVPLVANRFWRPGLRSGAFQLLVHTALVAALVGGVLARFTNFSIGGFELAYDHLALSFFTSPRAQMTIIVTAALASHLNRRLGWDFHGILVPALLALAVTTPLKLGATLVEAALILLVAKAALKLPGLRHANVEGPRKVVLCFSVGFLLKLGLAHVIARRAPGYRASDFFGFGYLLPSLLAERVWQRRSGALVFLPTLQTAGLGLAVAVLCAVGLGALAPVVPPAEASAPVAPFAPRAAEGVPIDDARAVRAVVLDRIAARSVDDAAVAPDAVVVDAGLRLERSRADATALARAVASLGLQVRRTAGGWLVVDGPGFPVVMLAPASRAVAVAAHRRETGTAEAALAAAATLGGDVVAPARDGESATALGQALALARPRPLVIVRGAATLPGGDVLVLARPATAVSTPAWLAPWTSPLERRFGVSPADASGAETRRAFPRGAGLAYPVALVWLGGGARRAIADTDGAWLGRAPLLALAADRGVDVAHTDAARWLAEGRGAPPEEALAVAERFARTRDVALLAPKVAGARLALIVDEARGLAAVAVDVAGRRALALPGERREDRQKLGDDAEDALGLGARVLLARGAP